MGAPELPLLSALFAPTTASEFLQRHWPGTPLEVHGPPERLPPVLRDPALASAAELARRYAGRLRYTHGGSDRMVPASETNASTLLDMGLTVQLVDLDACVPSVRPFSRQIESELGLHEGAVSLSAFAAARDEGLPCHFDAAELISVQLAGGKRFHYAPVSEVAAPCGSQFAPGTAPFDELYPQAAAGFPQPGTAGFRVADMRPGSVLFLPRGYWHHTSATASSLSVSICIDVPPALRSLLDQLRCLLLQDPRWRRPLYESAGREEARRRASDLLDSLPGIVARIAPDDLLDAPARLDWRLKHITGATRFQRTPHGRMEVGSGNAEGMLPLRFFVNDRVFQVREVGEIEVSPPTVPLLCWIESRTQGPFSLAQAAAANPMVAPDALKEILRYCTQGQLLRVLWYPALG